MTNRNTPSFSIHPRCSSVNVTTANASLTAPTNVGLLYVAGPDGADIYEVAAIATASQTSANQLELFTSFDYGTTFTYLPFNSSFAASAGTSSVANFNMPNGVPMGPSNPLILSGAPGAFTMSMQMSQQTELSNVYAGALPTGGSANAQTCAAVYNNAGTQLSATPATGTIVDLFPGLTNSGALTLQLGLASSGVTVQTHAAVALAGNEVTKFFRYRFVYTGTVWMLLPTQRLFAAISQTQAVTFSAWGADR